MCNSLSSWIILASLVKPETMLQISNATFYVAFSVSKPVFWAFPYSVYFSFICICLGVYLASILTRVRRTLIVQNYVLAYDYKSTLLGIRFNDHAKVMPIYPLKGILGPPNEAYTSESMFSSRCLCGLILAPIVRLLVHWPGLQYLLQYTVQRVTFIP